MGDEVQGSVMADPAGLDAAIEAAATLLYNGANYNGTNWWLDAPADTRRMWRIKAEAAIRAAAPHLVRGERAAALREAADEFARDWRLPGVARRLRDLAGRETTR
jgi:hypothetical protein